MNEQMDRETMLNFLCETYRYAKSMVKLLNGMMIPPATAKKLNSSTNRISKKITEFQKKLNVDFVDFTNSEYSAELPVEVLNLDDFEEDDILVICDTLEPTIKEKDSSHIIRFGKVLVDKKA